MSELVRQPCFGDTDLLWNVWTVALGRRHRTKPEVFTIDFAVPVTPWPDMKKLTDPEFEADLTALKVLLNESVKPAPEGWVSSNEHFRSVFNLHVGFIRWRLANGVKKNADLLPAWYRLYADTIRWHGKGGLLPFAQRRQGIIDAIRAKKIDIPLVSRRQVDTGAISAMMGVSTTTQIPASDIRAFKAYFKRRKLRFGARRHVLTQAERTDPVNISEHTAVSLLSPWFMLAHTPGLEFDRLGCKPFARFRDIGRSVRKWARPPTPTDDIPPEQTCVLVSRSLELITSKAPRLSVMSAQAGRDEFIKHVADLNAELSILRLPLVWGRHGRRRANLKHGVSLREFVCWIIPEACAVIIANGTARRSDEIGLLKEDCLEQDEFGAWWLKTPIVKGGYSSRIPIPASVRIAVETMLMIRQAFPIEGSDYLFDLKCFVFDRRVDFDLNLYLKRYPLYVGVPALADGTHFVFKSHQFRKFFAVTYFYRYKHRSLVALTYHYDHYNSDSTRAYIAACARAGMEIIDDTSSPAELLKVAEAEVLRQRDFEQVQYDFACHILREAALGLASPGGRGTLKINALLNRMNDIVRVDFAASGDPHDTLNLAIKKVAGELKLLCHPEGHGFCSATSDSTDLLAAGCLQRKCAREGIEIRDQTSIDLAYAGDIVCAACVNLVVLPELMPEWKGKMTEIVDALEWATGEQRELLEERGDALGKFVDTLPWEWRDAA
ncbi:hypothetical protein ELI48_10125 [Rhizobium ruizarguesonis]|uniref:hypothetical protein n=1 Tax=Rhizobium ruizarguesonis TaxID=2081791 RepID=UPI001031E687|nr:hypothetical protein [Rhizobium ruizarguesonis]TAU26492.1 hypothetical protein ELI48_10125 [Rhizobium ruizarguesonis]